MKFSGKKFASLMVVLSGLSFSLTTHSYWRDKFRSKASSLKSSLSSINIADGYNTLQKGLVLANKALAIADQLGGNPKPLIMAQLQLLQAASPDKYMMVMMAWQVIKETTGMNLDDLITMIQNKQITQLASVLTLAKAKLDVAQRSALIQLGKSFAESKLQQ